MGDVPHAERHVSSLISGAGWTVTTLATACISPFSVATRRSPSITAATFTSPSSITPAASCDTQADSSLVDAGGGDAVSFGPNVDRLDGQRLAPPRFCDQGAHRSAMRTSPASSFCAVGAFEPIDGGGRGVNPFRRPGHAHVGYLNGVDV